MAKKKPSKSSPANKTTEQNFDFEESLSKVEGIVGQLESGELGLTASLQKYEQGIHELKQCQTLLDDAEQKISQLSGFDSDGNPVTSPQPAAKKTGKAGSGGKKLKKSSNADTTAAGPDETGTSVDDSPGLF